MLLASACPLQVHRRLQFDFWFILCTSDLLAVALLLTCLTPAQLRRMPAVLLTPPVCPQAGIAALRPHGLSCPGCWKCIRKCRLVGSLFLDPSFFFFLKAQSQTCTHKPLVHSHPVHALCSSYSQKLEETITSLLPTSPDIECPPLSWQKQELLETQCYVSNEELQRALQAVVLWKLAPGFHLAKGTGQAPPRGPRLSSQRHRLKVPRAVKAFTVSCISEPGEWVTHPPWELLVHC